MAVWPSGLRRWLQAPVRKGVGSNPTAVTFAETVLVGTMNDEKMTTARGFEPLRAEPNGFLVHHLNHLVTLSMYLLFLDIRTSLFLEQYRKCAK